MDSWSGGQSCWPGGPEVRPFQVALRLQASGFLPLAPDRRPAFFFRCPPASTFEQGPAGSDETIQFRVRIKLASCQCQRQKAPGAGPGPRGLGHRDGLDRGCSCRRLSAGRSRNSAVYARWTRMSSEHFCYPAPAGQVRPPGGGDVLVQTRNSLLDKASPASRSRSGCERSVGPFEKSMASV